MLIQISSGIGAPAECERAVYLFSQKLISELDATIIKKKESGFHKGCYKSCILKTDDKSPAPSKTCRRLLKEGL